jgi:hypothetical protein
MHIHKRLLFGGGIMSDYAVRLAEQRADELGKYSDWIDDNKEDILYAYIDHEPEAPESIYEGVLDDDYEDAYQRWLETLTIDDVPDDFISDKYESAMMYDGADEYDRKRDEEAD